MPRDRRLWLLAAGIGWALLCALLYAGGHAPSRVLVPIPRQSYYLAQAIFVVPLLFVLLKLAAWVSHRVAGTLGGAGSRAETEQSLALALGIPILVALVIPDLVIYAAAGFSALARAIRFTAPLSALLTIALATRELSLAHSLGVGRALLAALAGVVAQALAGGVLLR